MSECMLRGQDFDLTIDGSASLGQATIASITCMSVPICQRGSANRLCFCRRLPARAKHRPQFFERRIVERRGPRVRHQPQARGLFEFFKRIRRLRH